MSSDEVFFKWSNEYSVNIKAIDSQHQELVGILNRLFVAISKDEGDKLIAGIMDALLGYTKTHFALEERLMQQAKYPDIAAHIEEHKQLIKQLNDICKKHLLEEKPVYFELVCFLKSWLKNHIQGDDMKYSQALQRAGFSIAEWEREATSIFTEMMEKTGRWWKIW